MTRNWVNEGEVFCPALNENIKYSGRIDFSNPKGVTMFYPSSYAKFRFRGSVCKVVLENKKVWWECEKGHKWRTTVGIRSKGCGCPKCQRDR